ncbi:MAG TPA: hypothetical protein VEI29_03795 [Burkholderiaceae bacterium]|nr:hypothetical protein [Burkholderiaceae bacterium]
MAELDRLVEVVSADFAAARSFKVKIGAAANEEGAPFGNYTTGELKFRAGEHKLPLLDVKGWVAISR